MDPQKAAHRPGQGPQEGKDQGEAEDKADGVAEGLFPAMGLTAREVGDVDGEHGQQAGRDKGNDALQK